MLAQGGDDAARAPVPDACDAICGRLDYETTLSGLVGRRDGGARHAQDGLAPRLRQRDSQRGDRLHCRCLVDGLLRELQAEPWIGLQLRDGARRELARACDLRLRACDPRLLFRPAAFNQRQNRKCGDSGQRGESAPEHHALATRCDPAAYGYVLLLELGRRLAMARLASEPIFARAQVAPLQEEGAGAA